MGRKISPVDQDEIFYIITIMPKLVDHAERRAAIARAAAEAVDELGLDRVRLVDVARRAGCTTGAVSHYYPDKNAVLVAALDHVLSSLADPPPEAPSPFRLAGIEPGSEAAARALVAALTEVLPTTSERQFEWRIWLAFCGRAAHDSALAARHRAAYRSLQARLVEGLDTLGFVGGSSAEEDIAACLMAALDGIGLRAVLEPEDWPPNRQRTLLAAQVLPLIHTVRREPGAPRPQESRP